MFMMALMNHGFMDMLWAWLWVVGGGKVWRGDRGGDGSGVVNVCIGRSLG